ncbi:unnamed protein product [Brassica oleracea var. botrytis]
MTTILSAVSRYLLCMEKFTNNNSNAPVNPESSPSPGMNHLI